MTFTARIVQISDAAAIAEFYNEGDRGLDRDVRTYRELGSHCPQSPRCRSRRAARPLPLSAAR